MKKILKIYLIIFMGTLIISCSEKKKEIPEPTNKELTSEFNLENNDTKELYLVGNVSKYQVVMRIEIDGNDVDGQYYYNSSGPNNPLSLSGSIDENGNIDIHETNEDGQPTGHFMGQWDGEIFSGEFVNYKGQHFQFKLVKDNVGIDNPSITTNHVSSDISDDYHIDYDGDSYSHDSSFSGSEDWDALLDSYERHVNKCISMLKKVQNGDLAAIAEYPNLLQEAEEYDNILENASDDLSPSQLSRYERINNKLANYLDQIAGDILDF